MALPQHLDAEDAIDTEYRNARAEAARDAWIIAMEAELAASAPADDTALPWNHAWNDTDALEAPAEAV